MKSKILIWDDIRQSQAGNIGAERSEAWAPCTSLCAPSMLVMTQIAGSAYRHDVGSDASSLGVVFGPVRRLAGLNDI